MDPDARGRALGCIAAAVRELPASAVEAFAVRLEATGPSGLSAERIEHLIETTPGLPHRLQWRELFRCLRQQQVALPAAALAWALRGAAAHARTSPGSGAAELVWTGPETAALRPRQSYGALLEVIDSSRATLTIASYAAYRVDAVREALLRAAQRGVAVRLILETPAMSGGQFRADPGAALRLEPHPNLSVYHWPTAKRATTHDGRRGALHMKCALADAHLLLISSANLTGHALDLNMELGLLVQLRCPRRTTPSPPASPDRYRHPGAGRPGAKLTPPLRPARAAASATSDRWPPTGSDGARSTRTDTQELRPRRLAFPRRRASARRHHAACWRAHSRRRRLGPDAGRTSPRALA